MKATVVYWLKGWCLHLQGMIACCHKQQKGARQLQQLQAVWSQADAKAELRKLLLCHRV